MSNAVNAPTPTNPLPTAAMPSAQAENTAAQASDNVAHALAGAGGGLVSMALTYPLITLSTRAQVESKKGNASVAQAVKRIIDREGVSGLYSGISSALFGISVTNFVYYYFYEGSNDFMKKRTGKARLSTIESMAAGAIAGSLTVLITNPIWVVNTRQTARKAEANTDLEGRKTPAPSTISTFIKIIQEEGFGRLFAGVLPALVLVINPILQYTIFEQLKQVVEKRRKVTARDSFLLGALGKLCATAATYPYIVTKARAHVATGDGQKEGMTASLRRIVREEGVAGLYGGIGPKLVQSVLTAAFLFALKDVIYDITVKARQTVVAKRLAA